MLRQIVRVSLLALLLLLLTAPPNEGRGGHGGHHGGRHHAHHGHHHGRFHGGTHFFVGVGPWWWGPPYPWWYYDPYWYPPRIVIEQPPIYVEQGKPTEPGYWYYCASAQRYYPDVATCQEAWIKVPLRPN